MPRNGSGVYSKPAGTTAVPNSVIESAKYNSTIDDIAADLNLARPLVAGGTGGTTVAESQANLSVDNKIVYTSRALDYTALVTDNNAVSIFTAAKTLSLTAAATLGNNWHHTVIASSGAVIIDPNAAELIDGAATITVPSGKAAVVWCTGSAFNATIFDGIPKAVNYTAIAADSGGQIMAIAAITIALTAAATLTSTWKCRIVNASSGSVVIDPNASELINGATTLTLTAGQYTDVTCTGTAFTATSSDPLSGPQLQGYLFGLTATTNGGTPSTNIDVSTGAAAADVSPFALMQLTTAITKNTNNAWAVGTGNGSLDTGAIANSTYYGWLIQRSDTGVVDILTSLSSTAPTMPANYDRKRLLFTFTRTSGVNGMVVDLMRPGIQRSLTVATTSGAAIDFTAIPANAKRITVTALGVSTTGSSEYIIQLGTSSGLETTGYLSHAAATGGTGAGATNGLVFTGGTAAASVMFSTVIISLGDAATNRWNATGSTNRTSDLSNVAVMSGTKPLASTLSRLRLTTVGGTDTFDAGAVSISWEI